MTSSRFGAALMAAGLTMTALPPPLAADQPAEPGRVSPAVALPRASVRQGGASRARGGCHLFFRRWRAWCRTCRPRTSSLASKRIPFRTKVAGELRILPAAGGVRHVQIRLQTPNSMENLLWILGHELHHAMEVAAAPEVRDQATQRAFFVRVGWERDGGGRFETEAAVEAGRLVAREVGGCRAR